MSGAVLVNIQVLRGIAALLVVARHLGPILGHDLGDGIDLSVGSSGVDLFFVISGFIMVHTTRSGHVDGIHFLVRRFLRVSPLYYLITFVLFLAGLRKALEDQSWLHVARFLESITFVALDAEQRRFDPIYGPGWTLSYEMFFYGLFAAALSVSRRSAALITSLVIVGLSGLGQAIQTLPSTALEGILWVLTRTIVLDFVLGMAVGALTPTLWRLASGRAWIGVTALAAAALLCWPCGTFATHLASGSDPMLDTFVRFGIPATAIVLAAIGFEAAGMRLTRGPLAMVGKISYSVYLSHAFTISAIAYLLDRHGAASPLRLAAALATPALSVLFGLLVFRTLEDPLGRLARSMVSRDTCSSGRTSAMAAPSVRS